MLVSSCRSNDKATTMLMSNDKKQKMCRMCGRGRSGTRCADVRTHVSYVTVLPSSEPALSFFIKPPGPATFVRISGTHRPATATAYHYVRFLPPLLIEQEASCVACFLLALQEVVFRRRIFFGTSRAGIFAFDSARPREPHTSSTKPRLRRLT